MVSIASVAITASQHIWSSDLILLVGPKVVYISLTWWQSKLSLFSALYSQPEQLTVAERIIIFFFFKHLTGSSSVGPGELSLEDWAWCFKWFCLFWEEQVCDSKAHQQDWWFVCLVLFLLRGPVWFSLSVLKSYTLCTQRGGRTPPGLPALSSTEMPRWRIIPVWWAALFFFQQNRWALLLDSSGINRMIIKYFIVL